MAIFTHVTVGTNDLAKARSFYDRVLGTLGYKRLNDLGDNGSIWGESAPEFFVLKPANGQPASFANGGTVSFVAPSRAAGTCSIVAIATAASHTPERAAVCLPIR